MEAPSKRKYNSKMEELRGKITQREKRIQAITSSTNFACQDIAKRLNRLEPPLAVRMANSLIDKKIPQIGSIASSQKIMTSKDFSFLATKTSLSGILGNSLLTQCRSISDLGRAMQMTSRRVTLMSSLMTASNKVMLGDAFRKNQWMGLSKNVLDMRISYSSVLTTSISQSYEKYMRDVIGKASREMLVSEYTFGKLINTPDIDDFDDDVIEIQSSSNELSVMLQKVAPDLVILHKGAHEAFQHKRTDYARHVLTSIREFWNIFLRDKAPEKEVRLWATTIGISLKKKGYIDGEKITRRGKFAYLYRHIENTSLADFVADDANVIKKMFDICNRLHSARIAISDTELEMLLMRSDSMLQNVLTVITKGQQYDD